ncbi:uracil-DNA glycosylase [Candidatus Aquiluna sp. UB-MaderosW2red]|uniref:uracil-DNA glycosylase n=1 Tax=Candidatus Aquiluna sp. UB-MaderosW2red TaxID=1855377 RepID=UPI0018D3646C|nr:uracil-DNA glycosylase [Candidatus Aquiluna sp. UB-MaderosW2red]
MFFNQMHIRWQELLAPQAELLAEIEARVMADLDSIPQAKLVMRAFELPPEDYRVLIVGQDPYPNPLHATGLAFVVPPGTHPLPPTLANIFRELRSDLGEFMVKTGDISPWANRGVMLLNRHLTTKGQNSAGHLLFGWDKFTTSAVSALESVRGEKLVAILWGLRAQQLKPQLSNSTLLQSAHPSPLSSYRGFFGSKPFSKTNRALIQMGEAPIDWSA